MKIALALSPQLQDDEDAPWYVSPHAAHEQPDVGWPADAADESAGHRSGLATGMPLEMERVLATACMLDAMGDHEITLLLPLQSSEITMHMRLRLERPGCGIRLRIFELPAYGKDLEALDEARSLVWTRFLRNLDVELLMVFQDPSTSRLRCTGLLPGKVLAFVKQAVPEAAVKTDYRGIEPQLVEHAQPGAASTPLLDAEATSRMLEQTRAVMQASVAPQRVPGPAYTSMVSSLRTLRRPPRERLGWAKAISYNEGPAQRPQLLLDVSVIVHGDARSGIQRVVRSLVSELLLEAPAGMDVRLIHFMAGAYRYANVYARTRQPTPHLEPEDTLLDLRQGDVYLALDLNSHLVEPAALAFKDMQARGVSLNFVVYDILLIHHPEWWMPGTSEAFGHWLRSIATLADTLVCISDAVASDVKQWTSAQNLPRLGLPQVASFHLGADLASGTLSRGMPVNAQEVLATLKSSPSFVMVGTVEPRKGHAQTLAAFEVLWDSEVDCNLVIVGKAGWLVDELAACLKEHPKRGLRLFWLEGISDEYLEAIYKACACLISASLGEGFGLPLIEAAQNGLPIIARELPVFREVAENNVHYFEGDDAQAIALAVTHWLSLHRAGNAPDSRRIRYLTWKESALQLRSALGK
jgi:glycosyltransferase involved in cell wall biosynthesis